MRNWLLSWFSIFSAFFVLLGSLFYLKFGHEGSFLIINNYFNILIGWFFYGITQLGDGVFAVLLSFTFMLRKIKQGVFILISYSFSSLVSRILKDLVFKEEYRPAKYFGDKGIPFESLPSIELYSFHSFPSGHTISAFAVFGMLAYLLPKTWMHAVLGILAILVAFSRVYIGQHFVRDVLAGAIIGYFCTLFLIYLLPNINWPTRWESRMNQALFKRSSQ